MGSFTARGFGVPLLTLARVTAFVAASCAGAPAFAQQHGRVPLSQGEFQANPTGGAAWRGCRVALSGPWLALSDLTGGVDLVEQGPTGWSTRQSLVFGTRVTALSFDGDRLAVGLGLEARQGEVQTWRLQGGLWSLESRIFPTRAAALGARFGTDVVLRAGRLVVGAPGDDELASGAGAVEVFALTPQGFVATARLWDPSAQPDDQLGEVVAHAGDLVLAGATPRSAISSFYDFVPAEAKPVRVFRDGQSGWTLEARLETHVAARNDGFGAAFATDGSAIAIGAPMDQSALPFARGRVDVFERSAGGWGRVAKARWIPWFGMGGAYPFGSVLAMEPGVLVIADHDYVVWGWQFGGGIHLYSRHAGGWQRDVRWSAYAGCHLSGGAIALDRGTLALASPDRTCVNFAELAPAEGRRYCQAEQGIYRSNPDPPGFTREVNRFELLAAGPPLAAGGVTHLIGLQQYWGPLMSVQLLMAPAAGHSLNPGDARGVLCLAGPLRRRLITAAEINYQIGLFDIEVDWTNLPGGVAVIPGETWYFQLWGRRASNSVFSGAIALTVR